jgi:hypothetical protein
MENSNLNSNKTPFNILEIDIKHKYIYTLEDFEKSLEEEYPKYNEDLIMSLSIVRNYLNSLEFSRILQKNTKIFANIKKLNL